MGYEPFRAPTSVFMFVLLILGVGAGPQAAAGAFDGVSAAYRIDLSKKIPPLGEDNYLDWLFSISTCFAAMGLSQLLTGRYHDAPQSRGAQSRRANEGAAALSGSPEKGGSPDRPADGNRSRDHGVGITADDYSYADSEEEDVLTTTAKASSLANDVGEHKQASSGRFKALAQNLFRRTPRPDAHVPRPGFTEDRSNICRSTDPLQGVTDSVRKQAFSILVHSVSLPLRFLVQNVDFGDLWGAWCAIQSYFCQQKSHPWPSQAQLHGSDHGSS